MPPFINLRAKDDMRSRTGLSKQCMHYYAAPDIHRVHAFFTYTSATLVSTDAVSHAARQAFIPLSNMHLGMIALHTAHQSK